MRRWARVFCAAFALASAGASATLVDGRTEPAEPELSRSTVERLLSSNSQDDVLRAVIQCQEHDYHSPRVTELLFGCAPRLGKNNLNELEAAVSTQSNGPAVAKRMMGSKSVQVRRFAAWVVADDPKVSVAFLARYLRRGDAAVRRTILYALIYHKDPAALPHIVRLLGDPSLRPDAVRALGWRGDPAALPYVERLFGDPAVRRKAMVAAVQCGSPDSARLVLWFLKSGDGDAINTGLTLAWQMPVERRTLAVTRAILELTYHRDPGTRGRALFTLTLHDYYQAVERAFALATDKDDLNRQISGLVLDCLEIYPGWPLKAELKVSSTTTLAPVRPEGSR